MDAENPENWFSEAVATLGDRLTAARENAGLSCAEAASCLGISVETYTSWEQDSAFPRASLCHMIAGLFGVSLAWLLTGESLGVEPPQNDLPAQGPCLPSTDADLRCMREDMAETRLRVQQIDERLQRILLHLE
ncbi:helix-turn-helix domain-containing protein [Rhodobacter capsulatus]|jgi:transcriptional regulator with XRE-family HTH domain|uniref:Transcriptional regulator, XRE family n=1 Tax=Rhodobacter capsulatus (strain ATCC BAA-309 / NBRC 16581 / SB1003) TaxID=272942 RepID=D5AVM6_RHOCB|nr:helix-turn-helix transcriptional regulator [Rhodobacter capsulatus]ADE87361.1 transcriptional regulator, XRE family [Rhodobacter capsulatus SB 1003]ETE52113.1 XRE family transcriptional regulator [Rhodobacter capsulatus Y262]MDS0927577.1 helix-turn-helix domain-containing protein [Rhodobacter capsulatus]